LVIDAEIATRKAASSVLNRFADKFPELVGGSADLASSNKTRLQDYPVLNSSNYAGRNVSFGVREFAMGAIANGMALHYMKPYVGTFFVFSDYLLPSI